MSRRTSQSDTLPASVFGPEYYGATTEDLGVIGVQSGLPPLDVTVALQTILSPAGYIVRYVTGEYTLVGSGGGPVVGGPQGLKVRWRTQFGDWVVADFPNVTPGETGFSAGWELEDLLYCELTEPGRIQLIPPRDLYGTVSVRVIRAIPRYAAIPQQSS